MKNPLYSFGASDLRERMYVLRSLTFCLFHVRYIDVYSELSVYI
ncbi:unnamed protein product [Brassica oleracea var. botrytis]